MDSGALKAGVTTVLLLLLLFSFSVVSIPWRRDDYHGDPSAIYTYDRFSEVKHHCAPVLPVLAELKQDDSRGERIKKDLWFVNGDWSQGPDAVPLIPAGNKEQNEGSNFDPSTNLVSFWVMDVDSHRRSDNMVSISGILDIGFSRQRPYARRPYEWKPDFETGFGSTMLIITFEGVYVESDENSGERRMCLLGTSLMPDSDVSLNHVPRGKSLLSQNDQIMILLRYPKTFNLTSRVIYGEMESLAAKTDPRYFGKVSISSQLNELNSWYQFGSAEVSKACSHHKDSDTMFHGNPVCFQGKDYCYYLQGTLGHAEFKINPNQNHKSLVQDGLFGSFILQNGSFNFANLKLVIRNFICRPGIRGINSVNVSAEFSVSFDHSLYPKDTNSLSDKSLFAEGIWSNSERELCMAGCSGSKHMGSMTCDYRVSIFLPAALSIHKRSLVYGSITGINAQSASGATISFESVVSGQFVPGCNYYVPYDYSKIQLASAFKSRHQLASLVSALRRTLLKYPSYNPSNSGSLSNLPHDLTVRTRAVVNSPEDIVACKCFEENDGCNALLVELSFGSENVQLSPPVESQAYSEFRTVLISGDLRITGKCFSNVSLSVEGLYDPTVGTMHLMGCKHVRAFPVVNIENLEQGQDCMIEIEVVYPPTNVRWLLNQKLRISIGSQREKQDLLYFTPIVVWAQSITYPSQLSEKAFIRMHEKQVMINLLTLALLIMIVQHAYMNSAHGKTCISYISRVMLGMQASGYLIPFIIGSDVADPPADMYAFNNALFHDATIIYGMMCLVCADFFRLTRQVRASRLTIPNSASDVKVLIITFSIHVLGLSIFLNHYPARGLMPPVSVPLKEIETYWSLAVDLFLLPQIIANRLWQIRSKPLCKIYYIGFSLIRAFPHLYEYFRDPVYDSVYLVHESEYSTTKEDQELLSLLYPNKSSDIVIAMAVLMLAFVVYIQQRCNVSQPDVDAEATGESASLLEDKDSSD